MEKKTYKAMYGEVKTGDYVVCVINDYMHRSTDVDIGRVSDDGYVYINIEKEMGYNRDTGDWYVKKVKPVRKQVGGFGAVCKINPSDVPEDKKKEIEKALQVQAEKMKGKTTRKFKIHICFEKIDDKGNILETYSHDWERSTSTLSKDATEDDIQKFAKKAMQSHYGRYGGYHYPIGSTIHKVDLTGGQRKEVIMRSIITYEEVV